MKPTYSQITNSLIDLYKSQDKSLDKLLNDPIFLALPIDAQLEIARTNSELIRQGSKGPSALDSLKTSLKAGVLSGLSTAAFGAITLPKNPHLLTGVAMGGLAVGTGVGVAAGIASYIKNSRNYEKTNKYLDQISRYKDLDSAVDLLHHKRTENAPSTGGLINNPNLYQNFIDKGIPAGVSLAHESYRNILAQRTSAAQQNART